MAPYFLIVGVCWLLFFGIWAVLSLRGGRKVEQRSAPGLTAVRLLMIVAVVVAVAFAPQLSFGRFAAGCAAAGAALCIVGLAFATWARVALGGSWGMPMSLRDQQELVTSGPYAYVRHPIYTGVSLMALGSVLVYPVLVAWSAIMIAYFLFSVRREERDMERLFPDSYPAYKQRSKKLVPFVL